MKTAVQDMRAQIESLKKAQTGKTGNEKFRKSNKILRAEPY